MEILGIGINELVFIVIIALIILGPKDMEKAGKTIGKWLRDLVTSDGWKAFQQTSRELRTLPNRLMREANEDLNKINGELNPGARAGAQRPNTPNIPACSRPIESTPAVFPDNKIAPPATEIKTDDAGQEENA